MYKKFLKVAGINSREFKYIFTFFIVTRVYLTMIGVLFYSVLRYTNNAKKLWDLSRFTFLDIWGVWDSALYTTIAEKWYPGTIYLNHWQPFYYFAFFPLYPFLMRMLGGLINNYFIAGIIISNISLLIAGIFFIKLLKIINPDKNSKTAFRASKYLFLFPVSFILSGVFTESLFLALLLACFYYAEREKWYLVGILGFFLALTRPIGVFILLPLLFKFFSFRRFNLKFLFLSFLPLGFMLYMFYVDLITKGKLIFFRIQYDVWSHQYSNPIITLAESLTIGDIYLYMNAVYILFLLYILIVSYIFKDIDFTLFLLGLVLTLVPLMSGIISIRSMMRYTLPIFPLYIISAKNTSHKRVDLIVSVVFVILQGFLMVLWSNGSFLIV